MKTGTKLALVAVGLAGTAGIAYAIYNATATPPHGRTAQVSFAPATAPTHYTVDGTPLMSGTLTLSTGTHSLSVPATVGTLPPALWKFLTWQTKGGVSVSSPDSSSTTLTVTSDGAVLAIYRPEIL